MLRACTAGILCVSIAAACSPPGRRPTERVVEVNAPDLPAVQPVRETLEPPPPPTPIPTPPPATPAEVLDPPRGATLSAKAATQRGAVSSYCWSHGDGRSTCSDADPVPSSSLEVRRSEEATLQIDAAKRPNDLTLRPFQGGREGWPEQRVQPALETPLSLALDPGEWAMDVCAGWRGHAKPICWTFRVHVAGTVGPSPTPLPSTPAPSAN